MSDAFTLDQWMSGNGLLSLITSLNVPWNGSVEGSELDMLYHSTRNDKYITFLTRATSVFSERKPDLARVIVTKYNENWQRVWEALMLEYEPIENYNSTEEITETNEGTTTNEQDTATTHGLKVDTTQTVNYGKEIDTTQEIEHGEKINTIETVEIDESTDSSSELTHGETIHTNGTTDTTQDTGIYGFETAILAPKDEITTNVDASGDETHSGTDTTVTSESKDSTNTTTNAVTHSGTDTTAINETQGGTDTTTGVVTNSGTDDTSVSGETTTKNTRTFSLTRHGNIGVTTSQQMIQSEIELRVYNFFDGVFADIDKVCCLQVY